MKRLIYHSFSNFPLVAENHAGWFRDWVLFYIYFFNLWSSHNLGSSSPLENIHIIGLQTTEKNLPRITPKERCPIKAFRAQSHDEEFVTSTWTSSKIYSLDVCPEWRMHITQNHKMNPKTLHLHASQKHWHQQHNCGCLVFLLSYLQFFLNYAISHSSDAIYQSKFYLTSAHPSPTDLKNDKERQMMRPAFSNHAILWKTKE